MQASSRKRPSRGPITLASLLVIAATSPMAHAQSGRAQDPNAPRLNLPASQQQPATPKVNSDVSNRAIEPVIPRPAPVTLKGKAAQKPVPASKPAAGKLVTDRAGRPISGALEVGNNRVLDPRTGKIHNTVPTAGGAQVID